MSVSHTATIAANEPPAAQRGARNVGLPWVGSMESLDLHMSRRLALCRRSCELMALLWIEVELLVAPGAEAGAGAGADTELLQAAGLRLRNRVRGTDEVVQVAGLGFAVLLHGAGAETAALVEQRLQQTLTGTYGVEGHRLYLGVRMGRALFPDAGRNGKQLAEAACQDLALRQGS